MDASDEWYSMGVTEAEDIIMDDTGPALDPVSPLHSVVPATSALHAQFSRSNRHWLQIPLDTSLAPRDSSLFGTMTDDEILNAPAALLVHAIRTGASGGLQIISPRQTPLGDTMAHTAHDHRTADMHLTGSTASRDTSWPTVRGVVPPWLFPGQPIDGGPQPLATTRRTRTVGIKIASPELSDPVVAAFVGARAMVDLQARNDVGGAARDLSDLVAAAWGLDSVTFAHLSEASLAPTGALLRYAARADCVFPRLHAPVQDRLCISTAAHATGRLVYGEFAAMDWARARVVCSAAFYMASRLEGFTLMDLRAAVPPGNFSAEPNRAGILQMRPLPGSVWSFDPRTFAVAPVLPETGLTAATMPERVAAAMRRFDATARPVSTAIAIGAQVSAARSIVAAAPVVTAETVVAGYVALMRRMTTFAGRGRTAAAASRDYLYNLLESSTSADATRLVWTAKELRTLLTAYAVATDAIPTVSQKLARRVVALSTDIRRSMGAEAVRRRSTLEDWWDDMRSSLPAPLRAMNEGSTSWLVAATYYLLMPPTNKWARLSSALAHSSIRSLGSAHVRTMRLPATVRSAARVWEAAGGALRGLSTGYGAFYSAVTDACNLVADALPAPSRNAHIKQLRLAGAYWAVRAAYAQRMELVADAARNTYHFFLEIDGYEFSLVPNAGPAYLNWRAKAGADSTFPRRALRTTPATSQDDPRTVYAALWNVVMEPAATVRATRYYAKPGQLALDLYTQAQEMLEDVGRTIHAFATEDLPVHEDRPAAAPENVAANPEAMAEFTRYVQAPPPGGALKYWHVLAALDEVRLGYGAECEDRVHALLSADAEALENATYGSADAFVAELERVEATARQAAHAVGEAVT